MSANATRSRHRWVAPGFGLPWPWPPLTADTSCRADAIRTRRRYPAAFEASGIQCRPCPRRSPRGDHRRRSAGCSTPSTRPRWSTTLVELVRVPSVTGTDAESDLQHTMARLARGGRPGGRPRGPSTSTTCAPTPTSRAPRPHASRGTGWWARLAGEGEPALVLQGHVDVVPVGDLGELDRRATLLGAHRGRRAARARRLRHEGRRRRQPRRRPGAAPVRRAHRAAVGRCTASSARRTAASARFATLRRGHRGEVAVITEPTSGRLVTANAGALTFRIEVAGRAAHGSTRQEGVSARRGVLAGAPRPARARGPPQPPTRTRCSATTRCPTASRSAPCAPATGPARCPTCSSPRAGWACSWTRTPGSPARRSRMPSPWPPLPTPGCATTHPG